MIATEKDKRSSLSIDLSKPRRAPPLLPRVMQKPMCVGAGVGLVVGTLNWAILSIPLYLSAPAGVLLGIAVCIVASPGMRHQLAEQKRIDHEYKHSLKQRKGRSGAFTQFD
jgi:hypothetical protein